MGPKLIFATTDKIFPCILKLKVLEKRTPVSGNVFASPSPSRDPVIDLQFADSKNLEAWETEDDSTCAVDHSVVVNNDLRTKCNHLANS